MSLNRREFMKMCTGTVAGLGISQVFNPALLAAMTKAAKNHPVIWIQGAGCTGCSVTILNATEPNIKKVLLEIISLEFHPTLMASEGETALEHMYKIADEFKGKFSLVVEGAVPRAENGAYCIIGEVMGKDGHHKEITMFDAVKDLGAKSGSVLCVGTCSAFGGIPAAEGNVTDSVDVATILKDAGIEKPLVNIPGCPPHPDWIVGTIAHLLTQGVPELDDDNRPTMFFGESLHENCEYVEAYDGDEFAATLSDVKGCRAEIGCKGPSVSSDCYKRHWNGDMNWCINNAVCIGCVESGFPDAMSPFYEAE